MSHRNSFGQAYYGGRNPSPFTSNVANTFDRSFSDLYDYVDEDHNVVSTGAARSFLPAVEDEDSPDLVHITYLSQRFSLEFPPFSISEEGVRVKHVRDRVAQKLSQHPGRVRLVYKQRDLKRNEVPLKKYGCKQNSELSVVITNDPLEYSGYDTQSGSEGESGSAASSNKTRPRRSNSTYRQRSDEQVPTRGTPASSNGFLHPDHSHHNHHRERRPSKSHRKPSPVRTTRQPSPARPVQQSSPVRPTTTASPIRPPTADPSTPMGKVQALRYEWQSKWLPEVESFLKNPPSDPQEREKEYRRLSEMVYLRILEGGDGILVGDDMEARAIRKETYTNAQLYLQKLDRLKES